MSEACGPRGSTIILIPAIMAAFCCISILMGNDGMSTYESTERTAQEGFEEFWVVSLPSLPLFDQYPIPHG